MCENGENRQVQPTEPDLSEQKQEGREAEDSGRHPGARQQARQEDRRPPVPFSIIGMASAVYALFYTFCLYKNASGITYPFFVAGTLCYLFYCMKKYRGSCGRGISEIWPAEAGKGELYFYMASLLLLGLSVCMTADRKILWMTKTGVFLLTVMLSLRLFYRTEGWTFPKYVSAICRSLLEMLHYLDTPFSDANSAAAEKEARAKNKNVRYVLLGLVIAVPLALVILALLLSADPVFEELMDRAVGGLDLVNAFLICLTAVFVYVLSYSFIRGLTTYRMPENRSQEKKGEPVAAITFTSLIALIYLVFCAIQVVYLFLGKMQLPEGLTWASYARQGFFQLLFVCMINLCMVLICMAVFKESRILKFILTAISLMTYILIASSAYRMILYIQNYYLTFLRLFVLWSLAVIAVVFAGIILSISRESFPLFGYCTVVVTVFYLGLAFARPDYWIARYDLAHEAEWVEEDGEKIFVGYDDYLYLSRLSADAAPVLAERNYGKGSFMEGYYIRVWEDAENMGLRGFNFSLWQAKESLDAWHSSSAAR